MYILFAVASAIVTFAVQLILCLKVKPLAVRLIPIYLIAIGFLICGATALFGSDNTRGFIIIYAWQAALLMAVTPLLALIGDGLAWSVSTVVKRKAM